MPAFCTQVRCHTSPLGLSEQVKNILVPSSKCLLFIGMTKHHDQKAMWGTKGLFGLHTPITDHHQRKPGQELKREHCFLACSRLPHTVDPVGFEHYSIFPKATGVLHSRSQLSPFAFSGGDKPWPNKYRPDSKYLYIPSTEGVRRTWKHKTEAKDHEHCSLVCSTCF